jgi:hypothetical protein
MPTGNDPSAKVPEVATTRRTRGMFGFMMKVEALFAPLRPLTRTLAR